MMFELSVKITYLPYLSAVNQILDGFLPTANKFVLSTRSHIDVSGNAPVRLKYKLNYFC